MLPLDTLVYIANSSFLRVFKQIFFGKIDFEIGVALHNKTKILAWFRDLTPFGRWSAPMLKYGHKNGSYRNKGLG